MEENLSPSVLLTILMTSVSALISTHDTEVAVIFAEYISCHEHEQVVHVGEHLMLRDFVKHLSA